MGSTLDAVKVGDELPPLSLPTITRDALLLFAEASGDPNPIHIEAEIARAAGMPDVIAHGMLLMAWLGRLLTQWTPQHNLREFGVRFSAITHVGERITCAGRVVDKQQRGGEWQVKVEVRTTSDAGELKVVGDAWIALPHATS